MRRMSPRKEQHSSQPATQHQPIRRWPFLPTQSQAAALAKLLWSEPAFDVQIQKSEMVIRFMHSIKVSKDLRRLFPPLAELVFGKGAETWEAELRSSYSQGRSGSKGFDRFISNFLRRVLNDAVQNWNESGWKQFYGKSTPAESREEAIVSILTKRGPQPNPWTSIEVAECYREFLSLTRALRKSFVKEPSSQSEEVLKRKIEELLPLETVQGALLDIFPGKRATTVSQFFAPETNPRDIARAMTAIHIKNRGVDNKRVSVDKFIREGNKYLKIQRLLARPRQF